MIKASAFGPRFGLPLGLSHKELFMRFMLLGAAAMISLPVQAAEGMWMPAQVPAIANQLKQVGLALEPHQLANLKAAPLNAIVSLGGCSAAFLSPDALVATNHHCVYGSIQYNSTPEKDYLTKGFLAATLADELPAAPGSRIYVIEDLRDVTGAVNAGLSADMDGLARYNRMEANRKKLISQCERQPNRRCDVRSYFNGYRYYLQQQLEIQDVRLVYAPASGLGNFGGETDNWQWPRHTADFGFYRAYVAPDGSSRPFDKNNVPYKPKNWLKIATTPLQAGDYVMVAGFPGSTKRLWSAPRVQSVFETSYPLQQKMLADYADEIISVTSNDRAKEILYANRLRGLDNYKKKLLGEMAGANAINLVGNKNAEYEAFKAWVAADHERQRRYGAAIAAYERFEKMDSADDVDELYLSLISRGQLYAVALMLYRNALEREKPDAQREPGYQDRDQTNIREYVQQIERRFEANVDKAIFADALIGYRKAPASKRNTGFEAFLARTSLDQLYAQTRMTQADARMSWITKSAAEFRAAQDPFIRLAVASMPHVLEKEEQDKRMTGAQVPMAAKVMEAQMAYAKEKGQILYPDANGTLRLTYGLVAAKAVDGMTWQPFTTAEGLVAKQLGKGDFNAPQAAIDLLKARDFGPYADRTMGTLPVNFLSTVDITNGNSGSSTLNAKGEFVGLAFDGTLDGVVSDWRFVPAINRTIHVDSRFMLWVMDKVDHADRLLIEMGVK